MKRTSFQYRRWFVIDATPAQFGGLVEGLNSLFSTDEGQQWLFAQWGINRPFHVYGLPLPSNATTPVIVRYPGDGEIDADYRDPRFGWIDAIARLDGKTELAMTYNFDTPVLPLDARLLLWQLLFDCLEEAGCPVQGVDDETKAPEVKSYTQERTAQRLQQVAEMMEKRLTEEEMASKLQVDVRTIQRYKAKVRRRLENPP